MTSEVPLPAAGALLIGGVAALGVVRRCFNHG
ncbi:VPLPA-CTERM sorting domain-containing protein [Poseidonocella sedimentorum]